MLQGSGEPSRSTAGGTPGGTAPSSSVGPVPAVVAVAGAGTSAPEPRSQVDTFRHALTSCRKQWKAKALKETAAELAENKALVDRVFAENEALLRARPSLPFAPPPDSAATANASNTSSCGASSGSGGGRGGSRGDDEGDEWVAPKRAYRGTLTAAERALNDHAMLKLDGSRSCGGAEGRVKLQLGGSVRCWPLQEDAAAPGQARGYVRQRAYTVPYVVQLPAYKAWSYLVRNELAVQTGRQMFYTDVNGETIPASESDEEELAEDRNIALEGIQREREEWTLGELTRQFGRSQELMAFLASKWGCEVQ